MNNYALITGGSKGVGKYLAIELAKRGYNLILVARSATDLQLLKQELEGQLPIEVKIKALDLTKHENICQLGEWIRSGEFPVSVLVNNAGFGLYGEFEHQSLDEVGSMLDLNVKSLVSLTHHLLPVLKGQKNAHILNVASTAAFQAMPFMGVYAASKAFVLSFSRALRYELKHSKINVSCLCPGPVRTAFWDRAKAPSVELVERISKQPEEIAKVAIKGLFERKAEIFVGDINRIGAFSNRLLPKMLVETVAAKLFSNKTPR
ncbi:SDR family NAD(P)-dependent oxidoreductase [Desertivirga brevis]|uniref:SDR family NAD(P)-dependent oxidoreductase n=1 Tax=Desertivirga brevis TaxID=2810310 RepID=UPI001A9667CC|nr:SDR family oxidoreductase [Pedobacter sp. SYSU D00873]